MNEIDFNRKWPQDKITMLTTSTLNKLQRIGLSLSSNGLAKLLKINKRTLLNWQDAGLLFPYYVGRGVGKPIISNVRKYLVKDVLRALTIKHLMSDLGYKKFLGVRLLLEVTNQALPDDKRKDDIDNIHIDRYLMGVLNYSIDEIAEEKLQANSKQGTPRPKKKKRGRPRKAKKKK